MDKLSYDPGFCHSVFAVPLDEEEGEEVGDVEAEEEVGEERRQRTRCHNSLPTSCKLHLPRYDK